MQLALALIPLIVQMLPTITTGTEHLIAWIASMRSAAQQTGEWTPELEQHYQAALLATNTDPSYKPAGK